MLASTRAIGHNQPMSRVLYYPSPVSKLAMWRELFAAAEVPARRGPYMFRLPFAAPADHVTAEALIAAREGRNGRPETDRARTVARLARFVHRGRRICEAARERGVTHLAIWNGSGGRRRVLVDAAQRAGLQLLYAELAAFPGKITLDPVGVNASGALPRDPDYFRAWGAANSLQTDLDSLRDRLVARAGKPRDSLGATDLDRPYLFAPLQVRGDTQVTIQGGWVKGMPDFIASLAAAAKTLPAGWKIVFREHPSCRIGNAEQLKALVGDRVAVDNATDTFELVRRSRGVVTLNSSVGLQSLLFDVPVLVLGQANYGMPGLVELAHTRQALAEQVARVGDWHFDAALRRAFLDFFIGEYLVNWRITDAPMGARTGAQVRTRLAGRITDWEATAREPANG
ncbi:hypothetical protein [Devosia sp.]|uniref:capsular polysaccharide export protein, LipB/KpsS family n=1 Tax=Devosia sp. TaxID=1871048 RepID=UPI003A953422